MENLEALLSKMRPYLVGAGIKKAQVNLRKGKHKTDTVAKAFDWLHDLYMHDDYGVHMYTFDLVPQKMWARYATLGITGLAEQKLLAKSSLPVRKLWKIKRPQIFGREKVEDNKTKNRRRTT